MAVSPLRYNAATNFKTTVNGVLVRETASNAFIHAMKLDIGLHV